MTVGVVGAGKFGTMFLAQARTTAGMHVVAVADLNVERAKSQLKMASWPAEQSRRDLARRRAQDRQGAYLTNDTLAMIAHPAIEVIVEATGDPRTGIKLATEAFQRRQACRDGQCRGGCARRSHPGTPGAAGRRRLFPRLGISRRSSATMSIGRGRPGSGSWRPARSPLP